MLRSHHVRPSEPLLPLAVFLLAPLLLAIGVGRHASGPTVGGRGAAAPGAPAAPATMLAPTGGIRGR